MNTNKQYKASLFSKVFHEPSRMLELYNALSGNTFPPDTPVIPATLEDVLFMDRINDVAFVVAGKLVVLVEHQSTINRNMPLRLLYYIARVYEKLIPDRTVYQSTLFKIPRPEFYVLYNGSKEYPDYTTLSLSDAFVEHPAETVQEPNETVNHSDEAMNPSFLELKVPVININKGHNAALIQRSASLDGYVSFVTKVDDYKATGYSPEKAVVEAVKDCLNAGILADILSPLSSEVINMLKVEFNLKDAQEGWIDYGVNIGLEQGRKEGKEEGKEEGRKEGRKEGREEGRKETLREVACTLKAAGTLSHEEIAQLLGFSIEEIRKI